MSKTSRPSSRLAETTLRRTGFPVSTTSAALRPSRSKTARAAGTEMHTYLKSVYDGNVKTAMKPQYVDLLPKSVKGVVRARK